MGASSSNLVNKKIDNNISNFVIWIDPDINNEENTNYLSQLKSYKNINVYPFNNVLDSIELIKRIKFEETNIVICGALYNEFIENFEENIRDICVIPKIIIFTSNKENFLEKNKNFKNDTFYSLGGIQTSFEEI